MKLNICILTLEKVGTAVNYHGILTLEKGGTTVNYNGIFITLAPGGHSFPCKKGFPPFWGSFVSQMRRVFDRP
jgi:hypothetical protein